MVVHKLTSALLACSLLFPLEALPTEGQEPADWHISSEPVVEIGVVDGDARYMFTSIQGASLLPDGCLVVADRGTSSVRVYGPEGSFEREMGAEGEGPGEFRIIGGMQVSGPDTIRVWDFAIARMTIFLADGSLVGTQRFNPGEPDGPGGALDRFVGVLGSGDMVLHWTVGQASAESVQPDRTVFGRFSPDGSLRYLLGEGEGLHRFGRSPDPFSPYPHSALLRDSLYFMNGVDGRVAVFGPEGAGVSRVFEVGAGQVETSEAWEALRASLAADGSESLLSRMPEPRLEHTPALAGMIVDDQGLLWVKPYDPTSDTVYLGPPPGLGGEWWVLSPGGEVVATVTMPERVSPLEIKGDRVLGVFQGPLDVQRVVVHTIDR